MSATCWHTLDRCARGRVATPPTQGRGRSDPARGGWASKPWWAPWPETGRTISGRYRELLEEDVGSRAMIEGHGGPPAQGTVRLATRNDVPAVAALHGVAIDDGFLSTLGERFLSRLYARIVASPHGFLLVAESPTPLEGHGLRLAGFVAGSAEVGRLYREFLVRDGLSVAVSSGGRLLRSVPRVVETLRHGATDRAAGKGQAPAATQARGPETELLALAVDGAERRRGVGAALVESFVTTAHAAGSVSARVVVGAENQRAVELYGRAGFRESARLELHPGTESLLMRVGLCADTP